MVFRVAVTGIGVKQQPLPEGEIVSQLPPFPVSALALKRTAEPSTVEIFRTCGNGFAPPNGMVKLIGFICVNTAVPTVTVTGIVAVSPGAVKTSSPVKDPGRAPPPARLAAVPETLPAEG